MDIIEFKEYVKQEMKRLKECQLEVTDMFDHGYYQGKIEQLAQTAARVPGWRE